MIDLLVNIILYYILYSENVDNITCDFAVEKYEDQARDTKKKNEEMFFFVRGGPEARLPGPGRGAGARGRQGLRRRGDAGP